MLKILRSTTYVLMVVLGSISAMGIIVSIEQYYFLKHQKTLEVIRREQDESFLIAMMAVGGGKSPEVDEQLAIRKKMMESFHSDMVITIDLAESRVFGAGIAWCVVCGLSLWAMFLNNHKQG